jgi:hypothetical protein
MCVRGWIADARSLGSAGLHGLTSAGTRQTMFVARFPNRQELLKLYNECAGLAYRTIKADFSVISGVTGERPGFG